MTKNNNFRIQLYLIKRFFNESKPELLINELQSKCHEKNCQETSKCPRIHIHCVKKLSMKTAVLWELANNISTLKRKITMLYHDFPILNDTNLTKIHITSRFYNKINIIYDRLVETRQLIILMRYHPTEPSLQEKILDFENNVYKILTLIDEFIKYEIINITER